MQRLPLSFSLLCFPVEFDLCGPWMALFRIWTDLNGQGTFISQASQLVDCLLLLSHQKSPLITCVPAILLLLWWLLSLTMSSLIPFIHLKFMGECLFLFLSSSGLRAEEWNNGPIPLCTVLWCIFIVYFNQCHVSYQLTSIYISLSLSA